MCPLNSFTRGKDLLQTSEWSQVNKEVPISDLENCSVCVYVVWCEREKGQEELGGQGSGEAEHGLAPGTVHGAEPCSECGVGAMIPPAPGGRQAAATRQPFH